MQNSIRPPAIAGMFYPENQHELAKTVNTLLLQNANYQHSQLPYAVIVPHAGYVYSGEIAACAYVGLKKHADKIKNIFLFGPAHRVAFYGVALPSVEYFATPLGNTLLNKQIINELCQNFEFANFNDEAHRLEHSIEVQLPFLQNILPETKVTPIVVGRCPKEELCQIFNYIQNLPDSLIIISTDLSHFNDYASAKKIDDNTTYKMLTLNPTITNNEACGAFAVNGLFEHCKNKAIDIAEIARCNSGDIKDIGDKSSVVGYASFALYKTANNIAKKDNNKELNNNLGETLIQIARTSIEARLKNINIEITINDFMIKVLQQPTAAFVTLTLNGNLRGCIGSLQAHRPLVDDLRENAQSAAFNDPRFPALTISEYEKINVEVSLLTPAKNLEFTDEADALNKIRPNIDGVILQSNNHRSTFLPQVWEQIPNPQDFISELKVKAGLPADYWSTNMQLSVYQVEKFSEA